MVSKHRAPCYVMGRRRDRCEFAVDSCPMNTLPLSISTRRNDLEYRITWLLWTCCALSIVFIIVVPTIPAVIFLIAILVYCALFPARPYQALTWNFVPWVIVVFGALSVIWSEQPMQSLRGASQIALSVLAALMFARGLHAKSFISSVMFAFIASNVVYLFVPSVFGSKNMVGQSLAIIVLASFWVMFDRQQATIVRLIALVALIAAPPMLISANSEGALLAGVLSLACSLVPLLIRGLHPNTRVYLVCIGALVGGAAVTFSLLVFDNLFDALLQSIGKDVSLTGRTLLWSHALAVIADHPFGVGLQAYWNDSNIDAVRFWETFYIDNHYGFHFHDLWLETGVELGVIGILIAACTTLLVFFTVWRWALQNPEPDSCFFAGFVTFILARTVGEVELYAQFSMTSMLFLAAYYYANTRGSPKLRYA
jgi:exopolysaccharide production protein ExoQ